MNNLPKRIEELERKRGGGLTLWMPDGSVRTVSGSGKRLLDMISEAAAGGVLPPDTQLVVDCVRDNGIEAGCGRMVEVVKCAAVGRKQLASLSPEELARLDAGEGEETNAEKGGYVQ
jgi:hypothetical protein